MQELKEYVLQTLSPEIYYQKRFPTWNSHSRPNVLCPFHEDGGNPNLSICLANGGARCHSSKCSESVGNIVHFESKVQSISELEAAKRLYKEFLQKTIPLSEIKQLHNNLLNNKEYATKFKSDTHLTLATCTGNLLGLDNETNRLTIPIPDRFGFISNVRYYALPRFRTNKTTTKIFNRKGFGKLEYFSWKDIKTFNSSQPLFWMKAEKDTMLAVQMGLQAFCFTSGEGAWKEDITDIFSDFNIYICGDNEESGQIAAQKKLIFLKERGSKEYKNILLPTEQKDFADWVVYDCGNKIKLLDLIRTKKTKISFIRPPPSEELPSCDLLSIGRNPALLNKNVRVKGIISGKSDRIYSVPFKFKIQTTTGIRGYEIPIGRDLLRFIRATDEQIIGHVRHLIKNSKAKIEFNGGAKSISELEIIPALSTEFDTPYVTQKCYYVGENIEANVPYEFQIMPTTEIRTQETVGIITKAVPITPTKFNINLNKDEITKLESLQSSGDIFNHLKYIADSISLSCTKIYHRPDWHVVALLSWACPLSFEFPNEGLQRGWLNTLAIGDTKTGKSEVVSRLHTLFGAGTFVSAENCTLVGLLGGAIKNAHGGFMLRWGKIPLNNRGLVVIEELSGLSIHEISNLSEIRSSGKARMDKGGLSSETNARTRLVFLSNVRGRGRSLSGCISGVKAIEDLIGHSEDISRFDLISTLTTREVSADIINAPRYKQEKSDLDLSSLKDLIQFIWSLGPEHIQFTKEAYLACLTKTKELGILYHPSIPLFDVGSGRLKLARIATAIACFCFNWNTNHILVEVSHIEAAVKLLQTLFDKSSCGYREYSEQMFHRESIYNEESITSEIKVLLTPAKRNRVFDYMIHCGKFTDDEIAVISGLQIHQAQKLVGKMIAGNVLRKGEANVWELTPIGKTWLEKNKI